MNDAPIGVFDSGVGGLTVLKALIARMPRESFVYLGDTARLPYGTKSAATVARYCAQAAQALTRYAVKYLVVACNTASSVGLQAINACVAKVPVIGVIEPGAQAACAASRSGNIAVIATEGTARGGAYQDAILRLRPGAQVTALAAPLFVALAEEGLNDGPIANAIAEHYLQSLFAPAASSPGMRATSTRRVPAASMRGTPASFTRETPAASTPGIPDTLVLGCTHFPMLADAIRRVVGPGVEIVDSAATTARCVDVWLREAGIAREGRETPFVRFLATDDRARFARVGGRFLGRPVTPDEVELIDL